MSSTRPLEPPPAPQRRTPLPWPLSRLPTEPKTLLRLDGAGALVTAASLGLVVAPLEESFGVPPATALALACAGALFSVFSLSSAGRTLPNHHPYLRAIAVANLSYCAVSVAVLISHWGTLTRLGAAYLVVEILVVTILASYELRIAKLGEGDRGRSR